MANTIFRKEIQYLENDIFCVYPLLKDNLLLHDHDEMTNDFSLHSGVGLGGDLNYFLKGMSESGP